MIHPGVSAGAAVAIVIEQQYNGVLFAVGQAHSTFMARSEFRVRMEGPVSIVEVRGLLDEAAAENLLEFASAAATACPAVQIDLDNLDSMTPEAAGLLLFGRAPRQALPEKITLRAIGQPGRQAVLRSYAQRRARSQTA